MKKILYIFLSIFLVSCSSSKEVKIAKKKQGDSYPSWFLEPSQNSNFFVGYAENFWIESSSEEFAMRNALENYSRFKGVKISGERLTATSIFQKGSQAFYEETPLNNYRNLKVVPISSFEFGDNYLLLSGFSKVTNFGTTMQKLSKEIPSDFENLNDSDEMKFAVGTASLENYSREFSVWLEAERDARIRLAEKVDSKISNLTKTFNGISESFTSTKVENVTLKNVQVLKRWKDTESKLCYVLVGMKK
ncbi:MAG: hypothetical protein DWQ06_14570 [Calditrichaeota bacterium]|nr:MAG: hypothetical protein DWQ06_14570 [Calditrichota bacterium]